MGSPYYSILKCNENFQKCNLSCSGITTIPNTSSGSEFRTAVEKHSVRSGKAQRIRKPLPSPDANWAAVWVQAAHLTLASSSNDGNNTCASHRTRGAATVRTNWSKWKYFGNKQGKVFITGGPVYWSWLRRYRKERKDWFHSASCSHRPPEQTRG